MNATSPYSHIVKQVRLLFVISFLVSSVCAQNYHHQDWWVWNSHATHFGPPTAPLGFPGPAHTPYYAGGKPMNSHETSASISDKAGNLLFYTEGVHIWDASDLQMPTPTGFSWAAFGAQPINTVKQGVAILCDPYSTDEYYVFYIDGSNTSGALRYFKVDMKLPGNGTAANPLGDVVAASRNTLVYNSTQESVTVIRHRNTRDWWIVCSEVVGNQTKLNVFALTQSGINSTPVYSGFGGLASIPASGSAWMRVSPDGSKFAFVNGTGNQNAGTFASLLFDFDNQTGQLSNPLFFPNPTYTAEFSSNSKVLYVQENVLTSEIYQFDLSLPNASIMASRTWLGQKRTILGGGILRGPDGKIYIGETNGGLGIIQNPNVVGTGCNYEIDPAANPNYGLMYSLNNTSIIQWFQHYEPIPSPSFYVNGQHFCEEDQVSFTNTSIVNINDTLYDTYTWIFGDPASGNLDTAIGWETSHVYSLAGTYTVTLIGDRDCRCEADTFYQTLTIEPKPRISNLTPPSVCNGSSVQFTPSVTPGTSSYTWSPSAGLNCTNCPNPVANPSSTTTYSLQVQLGFCSSDTNVTVSVLPLSLTNQSVTNCDSVLFNGITYYSSQVVYDTLFGAGSNGCDSIVVTTLQVDHSSSHQFQASFCNQYISPSGKVWTSAGVYQDTIPNAQGCDSLITVQLQQGPGTTYNVPAVTGCDSVIVNGTVYYSNTTAVDTFITAGCDSIVRTPIIVLHKSYHNFQTTYCGTYNSPSGKIWNADGTYSDTIPNAVGCDSILSITIQQGPGIVYNVPAVTACDMATVNGRIYYNNTIAIDTFQTAGCDSIVHTPVLVLHKTYGSVIASFCGSYTTPSGKILVTPGSHSDTIPNSQGCDSIINIQLIQTPPLVNNVVLPVACDSVLFNNVWYYQTQQLVDTFVTSQGCDSIVHTQITIRNSASWEETIYICEGRSIMIHGILRSNAGIYTGVFGMSNGCDSVATITLVLRESPKANIISSSNPTTILEPTVQFITVGQGANYIQWNFSGSGSISNDSNCYFTYEDTGSYEVRLIVSNEFCTDTTFEMVRVDPENIFYMPNSFSPNGDGLNDAFKFTGELYNIDSFEMLIYDRWGNLIFKSEDQNIGWDGRVQGSSIEVQQDAYVWKVNYRTAFGGGRYVGHVNVIR